METRTREWNNLPVPRSGIAIKKRIVFDGKNIIFLKAYSNYFKGEPLEYKLVWEKKGNLEEEPVQI
jgi:hypothetical protein